MYEFYGQAGGTKAAKDFNEWLVDCCREEMAGEEGMPNCIMADLNITPARLDTVKELMEEELWEDVGALTHWWGHT